MVEQTKLLAFAGFGIAVLLLVSVIAVMVGVQGAGVPGIGGGSEETPTASPTPETPTPIPAPTVSVGRSNVTVGDVTELTVQLERPAQGYGSVEVAITLENTANAGIRGVNAGDAGNLTVLSQSSESVTFRVEAIDSNQGAVTIAAVVVGGSNAGSTTVDARVREFTDANGSTVVPTVESGRVTVQTHPPSVTVRNQSFLYVNQPRIGDTVTVDRAFLPEEGFVVVYAQRADGSIGEELGHSDYLPRGLRTDITVAPDRLIQSTQPIIVRLHSDRNNNEQWDGPTQDLRYADRNRTVAKDTAFVEVEFVTTIDVVLTNSSDGLQRYAITLRTPADLRTFVTNVTPHYFAGEGFDIVRGGEGFNLVGVRGVDLNDELTGFTGSKTLLTVRFEDGAQLDRDQVFLSIDTLRDDNSSRIPSQNLTLEIRCESPFNGTVPGRPRSGPPTDPDCDGLYEDIDGDGKLTDSDVRALAFLEDHQLTDEQIAALDFNGNGTIDFGDVEELREEVREKS